jgi:septal ring factor EnvC (AmiA/AmiB activator)
MDSEDIAAQLAALNTGAKYTGKTLDRHERDFERIELEIKGIKDEKANIEKQYEALFSELQHKLNEVIELQESADNTSDNLAVHMQGCDEYKKGWENRSTWAIIKSDPIQALKIVGVFGIAVIIGSIIGWEKMISWVLKLMV